MRTTSLFVLSALLVTSLAGCTVSDVDAPPLSGPSSMARTIVMSVNRDTLLQDGVDQAEIRLTAQVQPGQSENVRLRAQVFVDGVAQDYGTLSNKNPVTPTTITYRAPAASTNAAAQVPTTVTIAVTPDDSGDFRGELARQVDIRLIPPGVILPTNPNLIPNFTFTPANPLAMQTVTFDASSTTNQGSACGVQCTYAWNFGDGTTGSGQVVTHQFRPAGTYPVTLTVTDSRGAQQIATKSVVVAPPAVPTTVDFTISPTNAGVNQSIFFNASASRAAAGRTLVSYEWDFGKGTTGSGVTVSKVYETAGTYTVTLKVTDDAGAFGTTSKPVTVGGDLSLPIAALTFSPTQPSAGQSVNFDASGSRPASVPIVEYRYNWGDGTTEAGSSPTAAHTYTAAGTYVVRLTVVDSEGRQGTVTINVTVT